MIKRIFDVMFSFFGLIVLSPFLLFIAIFIMIDSPGHVFYRGERTGRNGKPFLIYKFRSMVVDAEKIGGPSTALNDRRLTWVGRFLRKYKLDELPQLINVLKGEMSLVGPRPQVRKYTDLYKDEEKIILSVKPGITDYASIKFSNLDEILGDGNVDKKYIEEIEPEKNKLRIKYVKEQSFLNDLKILTETFKKLIRK